MKGLDNVLRHYPAAERRRIEQKFASMKSPTRRARYLDWLRRGAPRARDVMPGGLADHLPDSLFDKRQLRRGRRMEMEEHTRSRRIGSEIAKDHLMEDDQYYRRR